jgi:ribonuclease-3
MAPDASDEKLSVFVRSLGADSGRLDLFLSALTHGSCLNERAGETQGGDHLENNERLEFLGDAVLGLVMSHQLYARLPQNAEGQLSKAKARLVSSEVLARHARSLGLGEMLRLGRGEEMTGGRNRDSLLANALEAVIGAWYLSEGLEKVRAFVCKLWEADFARESQSPGETDTKSLLQEASQKLKQVLPVYTVDGIHGPDHDRIYEVTVSVAGREYGRGTGRSKKDAEQMAAAQALEKLKKEKNVV